jgi:hypothetical protein
MRQAAAACALPRAINAAAKRQAWAQSMSKAMHFAIAATCSSFKHIAAQLSHALAHALHALIQL